MEIGCTVVEAEAVAGGRIVSHRSDGFVVEGAPDSFLTQKPWALDLARELGLEDRFVGIASTEPARILVRGKLQPIPSGMALFVPSKLTPFLRSPILSPSGKLRVLLEALVPPRRSTADESLAQFVRRRLGREMLDVFGEPLLAGVYAAAPERMSLRATFPRFLEMERRSGSLLLDTWATSRARANGAKPAASKPRSPFISFRGGMAELIDALAAKLEASVVVGRRAVELRRARSSDGGYTVRLDDGAILSADAVVLATPAYAAADLLDPIDPRAAAKLRLIRYISTATVSLGYRQSDIPLPLKSSGFVIAGSEGRRITACTWSSSKFPDRAPAGRVLLRAFVGDARDESAVFLDDGDLLALVRAELRDLMGITAEPVLADIFRWPKSMPQYDVGHLDRIAALEKSLPPDVYVVGNAYRGIGIPDCVHAAMDVAGRIIATSPEESRLAAPPPSLL
jgi:oxygen-dependent protoporphyrinogen oxidase